MTLSTIALLLGGDVANGGVLAPGPGKPRADRSLMIRIGRSNPAGLAIYDQSNPRPDTEANRRHVCQLLNVKWPPDAGDLA